MIKKNKIIISLLFLLFNMHLFGQKNNLVPCQKDKYYCFCDSAGKVILSGEWEYVSKFNHGFAQVSNEKKSGYIDTKGKYESDCSFKEMGRFHNGYTWASNYTDDIYIINSKCEIKFSKTHNWGEHGAAFFDSIIVIYALNLPNECGNSDSSFGAVDYNFNIVIPFSYVNMLKSNSDRYYFVSKSSSEINDGVCPLLWGIYDIVTRKEIVPCSYKGSFGGQFNSDMTESTYSLNCDKAFFIEMEKLKIALPATDEISNQINGIFNW